MSNSIKTWHIQIKGQVQGIGYRPLVYIKALEYSLKGWVKNGSNGLHIKINSNEKIAENFTKEISIINSPPLAQITSIERFESPFQEFEAFDIIQEKEVENSSETLLTPDIALCYDCRKDLNTEANRRFRYGFITCTNCGPRYSIIDHLPYDRANTKMDGFKMCETCEGEYSDSIDRRYYSQTNSCAECGIQMSLYNQDKKTILIDSNEILKAIPILWRDGKIVAIKSIGGYLLTCDASNYSAIEVLRSRKSRPSKPLAVMYADIDRLQHLNLNDFEKRALGGFTSPIALTSIPIGSQKLRGIHNGLDRIGVMIPYTPLFQILLDNYNGPIVATSGNIANSPIVFDDQKAINELTQIADYIVTNDRNIVVPQDDSVVTFSPLQNHKIILRRSRGIAPTYINPKLKMSIDNSMSMGALLKSTFSILHIGNIHISQYLGDLSNYDVEWSYKHTLTHFISVFKSQPARIIVDKHPDYISTRIGLALSEKWNIPTFSVQHHVAHFSALLGEHAKIDTGKQILGVIWDGTGLGNDGNIWGGEFFIYDQFQFNRCHHLSYFDHLIGDKMAAEPRLSALSICKDIPQADVIIKPKFTSIEFNIYRKELAKKGQLLTSSIGRLFDAVASILGLMDKQTYEGEAAMLLEVKGRSYFKANDYSEIKSYLVDHDRGFFSGSELMKRILADIRSGSNVEFISAKFHMTLVHWIKSIAISNKSKIIGFSGGVFQNSLLVDLILLYLKNDYELLFHKELSPNDENISFGQLIYAEINGRRGKIE